IYAAPNKVSEFKYLADVESTEAVIKHEISAKNLYYRVSAVSGFGVEGEQSNIRGDDFQIGYAHYRNKNYDKAEVLFAQSYQNDNSNGEVLKYLGLAAMELNKVEAAVGYFRELTQLPGYEVEGLNYQIKALVAIKDYIAAKAVVDKVIADNTASVDTIVYCGELSLIMGDAIGAVTCLEQALEKDNKNAKAHFFMGKAYLKLGIVDKGMAEFKTAISIDPRDADLWYQNGLVYQDMKKYQGAGASFRNALKLKPDFSEARLALARMHLEQKQYAEVKNIAIKLAGNKETAAEGQYLLGITALATNQLGQALLDLTKSTRTDPSNAVAWLALVDVYIKMNQNDKVRDALVSAVKGDETSFDAAYRLGGLDFDAKNYAEAVSSLDLAVKAEPDHYGARYKLAYAQYRIGEYQQAANHAMTAVKLQPKNYAPLALQASIVNKQGKTGQAIDLIKQAMLLEKNSAVLYTTLGSFYADNSLFDQAKIALEKASTLDTRSADPYVILGALYSQRRLFDEAISAYDKAVKLNPSTVNRQALEIAYAEKKKSMEFGSNAPQLVLNDLSLNKIFSAAYKQYSKNPIGYVNVQNISAQNYTNLKLTFSVKGYMDFPSSQDIPVLNAGSTLKVFLYATFNNKVLEIDEDTGVQTEVAVSYTRDGRNDSINVNQPMTIYGKNAIVWGQPNMVGSFVTPKDDTLRDFVRQALNENKPKVDVINNAVLTAMTLFDVFTAHGIKYAADPNNPYSNLSENSVDYVQFSRETLKYRSGDCDDLSVLMSTALENLGVETAILDVPGHLLMMFNTGVPQAERHRVSANDDLLVIRNNEVWIPVEATMIGTTFLEAWSEGSRKYHEYAAKKELKVIVMRDAWSEYAPVTLKPATYTPVVPDKSQVSPIIVREKDLLLKASLDGLVAPYSALAQMDSKNIDARMQMAIIYAKNGLYKAAEKEFDAVLEIDPDNSAVYNNRGNIYFSKQDFERAIESYAYAEQLAANDAGVKMNLSMAHYKRGDLQMANSKYKEAGRIDDGVNQKYASFIKLLNP
ncbi:MAG: tetratricopeptide repeat protein, partial [Gammaproteobacteria bacterium]|nr:tetratricopeptide repeat protein [Gammaproteobacteria bacterium]